MIRDEEKLILIAEDEVTIADSMALYLTRKGYKAVCASNGAQALKLFRELRPNLVISDVRMPVMDGVRFLMEVRTFDTQTPFILTTAHPEINSTIEAIHHDAFDYILKPFQLEGLYQKVRQALNTTRLERENNLLVRLASLHEVNSRIAATRELPALLDALLQACFDVLEPDGCSIMLIDTRHKELNIVRQKGTDFNLATSALDIEHEWPLAKWCCRNAQSLLLAEGRVFPDVNVPPESLQPESALFVPLKVGSEIMGLISMHRKPENDPFSIVDLNTIDVLAAQASIAIKNANLYASVNQKLEELSLINSYSGQLMGLVERRDVVECLFRTVKRHFAIDMIGFLMVQKRQHRFLYWSRGDMPLAYLDQQVEQVIAEYNRNSDQKINRKRVTLQRVFIESKETYVTTRTPFAFTHTVPLVWEDFNFGAVYFGASHELENPDETLPLLSGLVNQTRIGLTNAKLYGDVKENYIRTIKALAIAVDAKDTYTHGHSENVMNLAQSIAEEMGMDPKLVDLVRDAGLLHDIGKIGIPGYILNKPGPLTAEEYNGIMKNHSTLGANIVKDVPFLQYLYSLILYHHENFDGTGYPEGLSRDEVPLGARILHVADAFEAMTSNRPYRDSLGREEAFRCLETEAGKQFDPEVVAAFVRVARKKGWLPET